MHDSSPWSCREFCLHSKLTLTVGQRYPKGVEIPLKRLRQRQARRIRALTREQGPDVFAHPVSIGRVRHGGRELPPSLEVVLHSAHGCVRRRDAGRNRSLHYDSGVCLKSALITTDSTGQPHKRTGDRQRRRRAPRGPYGRYARHAEPDLRSPARGLGTRRPNNKTLIVVISPVSTTTVSDARVTPPAASRPRASAAPVICRMPSVRRTMAHRRSERSWSVKGAARIPECDIGVVDIRLSGWHILWRRPRLVQRLRRVRLSPYTESRTMLQQARIPVDRLFRAFSDRTRLRILHLLQDGEMCVCDLVGALTVPQPTASRHLAYLRRAGLVTVRKSASWSYYRLAEPRNGFHAKLLGCLSSCFDQVPELERDRTRAAKVRSRKSCC